MMLKSINLVETLKINNFTLWIANGKEVYDESGNLLVCQPESGRMMPVPNTNEVRRYYNLPLNPTGLKNTVNRDDISRYKNLVGLQALFADEGRSRKQEDDDDEEIDVDGPENETLKRKRISDLYGSTQGEGFPRQALSLLTTLVTSPKYEKCLNDQLLQDNVQVWESIYKDMMRAGWTFGRTITEGALIISEKWRMLEKTILRKPLSGPRTMYTPEFIKAMLMEMEKRKALGPNYPGDIPSAPEVNDERLKDGGFGPEVTEALLKVIDSDHFQSLFTMVGEKRSKIWEEILEEVESQGFQIAGNSKREKVKRLYQKWSIMKKYFVKYQIEKFKGRGIKKPMFYEMMFKIISNEVLKMNNSECDSDEEVRMEECDGEPEAGNPPDPMGLSSADHDYGHPIGADRMVTQLSTRIHNTNTEQKKSRDVNCNHHYSKPSTCRTSRSHELLKEIKSLHETSLTMQQQNFAKITSLLENQVTEQRKLTKVISEYMMSLADRSR